MIGTIYACVESLFGWNSSLVGETIVGRPPIRLIQSNDRPVIYTRILIKFYNLT